jgi:hypothetical protein
MGYGLRKKYLRKTDDQRITEIKELRRALKLTNVKIDLESAQRKLEEYKEFAEKGYLTGLTGYGKEIRKGLKKEKVLQKAGLKYNLGETYDKNKNLYLQNISAIESIKEFSHEEKKPMILFRIGRGITKVGVFVGVTFITWSYSSVIMNALNYYPGSILKILIGVGSSLLIAGTSVWGISKIYKKLDKRRGWRNAVNSLSGREQNPMFNTATYLTKRKYKKALKLIEKIEKEIEKIKKKEELEEEKEELEEEQIIEKPKEEKPKKQKKEKTTRKNKKEEKPVENIKEETPIEETEEKTEEPKIEEPEEKKSLGEKIMNLFDLMILDIENWINNRSEKPEIKREPEEEPKEKTEEPEETPETKKPLKIETEETQQEKTQEDKEEDPFKTGEINIGTELNFDDESNVNG